MIRNSWVFGPQKAERKNVCVQKNQDGINSKNYELQMSLRRDLFDEGAIIIEVFSAEVGIRVDSSDGQAQGGTLCMWRFLKGCSNFHTPDEMKKWKLMMVSESKEFLDFKLEHLSRVTFKI